MVRGWQGPESKIRPFSTQLTPRPLEATWPIARCLPGCSLTQGLSAGQPSLPLLGLRARCQPRRPPVLSLPTVRRAGSWQEGRDCPQGLWAARRLGPPYSLSLGWAAEMAHPLERPAWLRGQDALSSPWGGRVARRERVRPSCLPCPYRGRPWPAGAPL